MMNARKIAVVFAIFGGFGIVICVLTFNNSSIWSFVNTNISNEFAGGNLQVNIDSKTAVLTVNATQDLYLLVPKKDEQYVKVQNSSVSLVSGVLPRLKFEPSPYGGETQYQAIFVQANTSKSIDIDLSVVFNDLKDAARPKSMTIFQGYVLVTDVCRGDAPPFEGGCSSSPSEDRTYTRGVHAYEHFLKIESELPSDHMIQ